MEFPSIRPARWKKGTERLGPACVPENTGARLGGGTAKTPGMSGYPSRSILGNRLLS